MPVAIRKLCARHAWWLAIACAYLYVFPYFPRIQSANELPRAYQVRAIVDEHTFAIDQQVARFGGTSDMSEWDHHIYPNKAPGAQLLAVPVYAAVRVAIGPPSLAVTMWLCRVVAGIAPTLLLLVVAWRSLERYVPDADVRRLVLVVYAFGSMAMTYSLLFFSHQLSAVCVASAWMVATDAADRRRGRAAFVVAGALAGAGPLVDYQAAFAIIPVAVFVLVRMRAWPRGELVRALVLASVGVAMPIAVLLGYHVACFGSPWRTGYATAISHAADHAHGLLGMTSPHLAAVWGTLLAPDNGLITLAPWLLLAVPGGVVLARRGERALVALAAAVIVIYMTFLISLDFWRAGWEIGPRYVTVMLPFMLPLVAAGVAAWRTRVALGAFATALMIIGVVVYAGSAVTFPQWPDALKNPLYDVTFHLFVDGAFAPNLARVCGVSGWIGALPWLLLVAGMTGWTLVRVFGVKAFVIGAVTSVAMVGALELAVPRDGAADSIYRKTVYPAVTQ